VESTDGREPVRLSVGTPSKCEGPRPNDVTFATDNVPLTTDTGAAGNSGALVFYDHYAYPQMYLKSNRYDVYASKACESACDLGCNAS
jgi:hypothetical protein